MLIHVATLALIAGLASCGQLVFPGSTPTSRPAASTALSGSARCPYPLPLGSTLSSLPRGCYNVTDEEDPYVPLANAGDVQCGQNYVRDSKGRCVRVLLIRPNAHKKPSKGPEGKPNW